ncbi:MAG: O-antigen ligase family protein [Anaerolineales bacterium]|nr:O-antigen ligase family protein [Anaerolineales bacterium]
MRAAPVRWGYLLREAALFLALAYVVLLGGTFNGLVLYRLNVTTTALIALVGAAWLAWRWLKRRPLPATALDLPLLALLAAYLVASAASVDPRRSFGATALLALYVLIYYLVVDLRRAGWPASLFVKAMLFAATFILFFGAWELERWFADWWAIDGRALLPPATLRLRAFLGHPNFVAAFFALLLPLALAAALAARGWAARFIAPAWALAAAVLVFYTSSRSGWLGSAAALAVLALLTVLDRRATVAAAWRGVRRRPLMIGAAAVALLIVILIGAYALYRQAQHPTHAGRDYIWSVALGMLRADPLTGAGPFTFGTAFIAAYSVPPEVLLAHAHNVYLNTTAEAGLLGAAALLALLAAGAWLAWRRWQTTAGQARVWLSGYLAALAGLGVTSLFDTPQTFPAIVVLMVTLAGLVAADEAPARKAGWGRVGGGVLAAGYVGVTAALSWAGWAYAPADAGVLAGNLGDWPAAARDLDTAAARDPREAFYALQAGFAHGQAALAADGAVRDEAELAAALAAYGRGLALEPALATNWANVGLLRWAAGDQAGGLAALERAVASAPRAPAFVATLAHLYEAAGRDADAAQAYATALTLRPDWATAYFFRATPLRRWALADWQQGNPTPWQPVGGSDEGWAALQAGDYAHAMALFAPAATGDAPGGYLGLALAIVGQGEAVRYVEAERAIRTALYLPGLTGQTTARLRFGLGRVLAATGDSAGARAEYEAGLNLLDATTSFGVGQYGQSDYGWYVFNRASLAADLLPGMEAIHYDAEAVAALLALGDLSSGDEAQAWYCRALAAAPDSPAATARAGAGACPTEVDQ